MRPAAELALLGKTLLNLDLVGRTLAPDFDPNAEVRRRSADIMRRRMWQSLSPAGMLTGLLDAREFVQQLPARLNTLFDRAAAGELEFKVRAIDEDALIDGIQKLANRITIGLIVAALIIGAALIMRIETDATIFGYPALAILLFLAAAAGGAFLVIEIWLHDRQVRRRVQERNE